MPRTATPIAAAIPATHTATKTERKNILDKCAIRRSDAVSGNLSSTMSFNKSTVKLTEMVIYEEQVK